MIRPTLEDLLEGAAASLEETVLPGLSGPTRRQTREAIRIVRRVARILDKVGPALHADNADMEDTLRAALETISDRALRSRVEEGLGTRETALGSPTPLDALRSRSRDLQALLLEVDGYAHGMSEPGRRDLLARLRALYRRSLERELDLR